MQVAMRWAFRPRKHLSAIACMRVRLQVAGHYISRVSPSIDNRRPLSTGKQETDKVASISKALKQGIENKGNDLITPVHISKDPDGILKPNHPATSILSNSSVIVQRQLEMMNVFLGFEQANKYVIMDPNGDNIGYLAEEDHGVGKTVARQFFKTHRSFTTHIFDRNQQEVLRFHRPFSWISSSIRVYDAFSHTDASNVSTTAPQGTSVQSVTNPRSVAQASSLPLSSMRLIGEAQQEFAPLRRKYNLFLARDVPTLEKNSTTPQITSGEVPLSNSKALEIARKENSDVGFAQFAYVNEPLLSWDFSLLSEDNRLLGSVNRNFAGFAREIFTDTGVYALRMDAATLSAEPRHLISQTGYQARDSADTRHVGMSLDQRAIMLATAVSIDFDYFSRHSTAGAGGMGFMPIWFPMGGSSAGETSTGSDVGGAATDPDNSIKDEQQEWPIGESALLAGGWHYYDEHKKTAPESPDQPGMANGAFAKQHQASQSDQSPQNQASQTDQSPQQGDQLDQLSSEQQEEGEDVWSESFLDDKGSSGSSGANTSGSSGAGSGSEGGEGSGVLGDIFSSFF